MEHTDSRVDRPRIDLAADADDSGDLVRRDKSVRSKPLAVVDVLWENQRGAWVCGLPLFSSSSLLQFDPAPWLNGFGKATAVNVTNAQTPDPTWQWSWPTWYVDMSLDVDEEGWQYSFMFRRNASWHGSHPWFHSYVRRRRWIRKRVKTGPKAPTELPSEGRKGRQDGHRLNADYFTIHPAKYLQRAASSIAPSTTFSSMLNPKQVEEEDEDEQIDSIATLLRALRRAKVDREKVGLVMRFLDEGGEDVHYIADEMEHIMSLFMFQYTRRQLLLRLFDRMGAASDEHVAPGADKTGVDSLAKAIDAAEAEVRKLEYWSDIRDLVHGGHTFTGADEQWSKDWKGLDLSGASAARPPETDGKGRITEAEARTAGGIHKAADE